jgi:hypothetical protein
MLLVLCAAATLWAVAVTWRGGFFIRLGALRVSSRSPGNIILIAVLSAIGVWRLSFPGRAGTLREEWAWWRRQASTAVAVVWRGVRALRPLASAVTIAVVGVALDVYQWAGPPPFWLDEETIALNVRDRSVANLAGPLWLGQSAPLGWLVLQRLVLLGLGSQELVLRLVPLLFGAATIAAAVWIGARWLRRAGAAALVLLCWAGALLTHYRFEVKHYTADGFWGLMLPALAVWALEANDGAGRIRRAAVWWCAAAAGQFFANGALLVTPACAVVMMVVLWRRDGPRAAATFTAYGLVWLASSGLHYLLSIRHTHNSPFLRGYWASHLPPPSAALPATIRWLGARIAPLAGNPGGTALWASLWLLALGGFASSVSRPLGAMFATVPLSAFLFAALGLVPLHERMSLWMVPALYAGVALLVDRAERLGTDAVRRRRWVRAAAAAVAAMAALHLCVDVSKRGWTHRAVERPRQAKHRLNDALAVRWLMRHHQPGDAIVATRLTWPAVWWYGGIPLGDGHAGAGRDVGRGAMYEVAYRRTGDCERQLRDVLEGHRRVLVYLGFRDEREGFEDLLLRHLGELGTVTALDQFASLSRVAVVDLATPAPPAVAVPLPGRSAVGGRPLEGCVGMRPARRW